MNDLIELTVDEYLESQHEKGCADDALNLAVLEALLRAGVLEAVVSDEGEILYRANSELEDGEA